MFDQVVKHKMCPELAKMFQAVQLAGSLLKGSWLNPRQWPVEWFVATRWDH